DRPKLLPAGDSPQRQRAAAKCAADRPGRPARLGRSPDAARCDSWPIPAEPCADGPGDGRVASGHASRRRQVAGRRPRHGLYLPWHHLLAADHRSGRAEPGSRARMRTAKITIATPLGPVTVVQQGEAIVALDWGTA